MQKRSICLLFVALLLLSCVSCGTDKPDASLEMRFLDVGQGDATLLRTSAGDILIDAGTDASQELLCLHLENLGVESLALAVFTHSDEDHIGGADGVLRAFPTETVWISSFFEDAECTALLLDAAKDTGAEIVEARAGTSRVFGDTVLSVLSPYGKMEGASINDTSLVIKVVCGGISAMLMGDAETFTETLLLEQYDRVQFDCDILKVGHHGASTSSGETFLKAARPQYAVISCGAGNYYGHPHGETVARLEKLGAEILRTDLSGDIVFFTDGKGLWTEDE